MLNYDISQYLVILQSVIDSIVRHGYGDDFVLIGAFSLSMKLLAADRDDLCRKTTDIDLSITDSVSWCKLLDEIEYVLNDNKYGYVYNVTKVRKLTGISSGVELSCATGTGMFKVKIDVNIREVDTQLLCSLNGVQIPTCNNEVSIADKVIAVCSEKIFRRVKDIYDIYCYSYLSDYSYLKIKQLIKDKKLKIMLTPSNIPDIKHAYKKNDSLPQGIFEMVIERTEKFVNPLVLMLLRDERSDFTWQSERGEWSVLH